MTQPQTSTYAAPTILERVASLSAWAMAAGIFLSIGWIALSPEDPLGPLSVFTGRGGLFMLAQAAALAGVVAGLATLLAGRQLADAGVFATALGLSLVSFRGATAEYFFKNAVEDPGSVERAVAMRFALESLGWFGVVAVSIAVSMLVSEFCLGLSRSSGGGGAIGGHAPCCLAGADLPMSWFGKSQQDANRTPWPDGWKHVLVSAGVTLVAFMILSAGLSDRTVRHGQACFVVAASVYVGSYFGFRLFPVRSALWPILSVIVVALLGLFWAILRPATGIHPPLVSSSQFTRILPIQFVAVGTASAVVAFWHNCVPVSQVSEVAPKKSQPMYSAKKR